LNKQQRAALTAQHLLLPAAVAAADQKHRKPHCLAPLLLLQQPKLVHDLADLLVTIQSRPDAGLLPWWLLLPLKLAAAAALG
jgi:hypothetical protein